MNQMPGKKLRDIILRIHELNQRPWFIVSLVITSSGIWFSFILNFFGKYLGLIKIGQDNQPGLTGWGLVLTIITVGWSLLSITSQRYYDYHMNNLKLTDTEISYAETLFGKVNQSMSQLYEGNLIRLTGCITKILCGEMQAPPIIEQPCLQLKDITMELAKNFSDLLSQKNYNLRLDDLHITIYFTFEKEKSERWQRAENHKAENGINIEQLLSESSTFYETLNLCKEKFVFYNSKEDARKKNHYIPDELDEYDNNKELKGSIACYRITVKSQGEIYIKSILTIATYSKKFTIINDAESVENIKYNIRHNLLEEYEKRIATSLCRYYISVLHNKRADQVMLLT